MHMFDTLIRTYFSLNSYALFLENSMSGYLSWIFGIFIEHRES